MHTQPPTDTQAPNETLAPEQQAPALQTPEQVVILGDLPADALSLDALLRAAVIGDSATPERPCRDDLLRLCAHFDANFPGLADFAERAYAKTPLAAARALAGVAAAHSAAQCPCGRRARPGHRSCNACLRASGASPGKVLRAEHRAAGLCTRCNDRAAAGGNYCQACRDEDRERRRASRAILLAAGVCLSCKATAATQGQFCAACWQQRSDRLTARAVGLIADALAAYGGLCADCQADAGLVVVPAAGGRACAQVPLCSRLKKAGYPPGYVVLCVTCRRRRSVARTAATAPK